MKSCQVLKLVQGSSKEYSVLPKTMWQTRHFKTATMSAVQLKVSTCARDKVSSKANSGLNFNNMMTGHGPSESPLKCDAFWRHRAVGYVEKKKIRSKAESAGEAFFFGCATTTIRAAFDHQLGVPEKKWFRSEIQSKVTKWYKMPFIRDRPWKFCFWSFGISSLSQAGSPFGFEIFDPIFP